MGLEYLIRITCDNKNCVYRYFKDEGEARKAGWECINNKWYCYPHANNARKEVNIKKKSFNEKYDDTPSLFEIKSKWLRRGL